MIVIICDSYAEARDSYLYFITLIEFYEPGTLVSSNEASLSVTMDDDLVYIFCDYHLSKYFARLTPDIMDESEFFGDLWERGYR